MKIITGKLKGKNLKTLTGLATRPTLNRIKENIFNIIENYLDFSDKVVVDPFGGSGNLAIESLSRNAKYAFINDINPEAYKLIKENLIMCNLEQKVVLKNSDYQFFLKNLKQKFDIIFIDPPFVNVSCQQWIIDYCWENKLFNDQALIVLESNVNLNILQLNSNFEVLTDKKYGKIYIKIIRFYEN